MNAVRRVRRLALRAPREELARRGAILIEDALRTASLPGDDGRLVVVRRLDVGTIRPQAAPASVALAIEANIRTLAAQALPAGAAHADRAPAVYFRGAVEAHTALALRLARAQPATAWYWRAAVPAWNPAGTPHDGLRAIALALAGREDARAAIDELLDTLICADALRPLLLALSPQDAERIAVAEGWRLPSASPTHVMESPAEEFGALPRVWQRALSEAARLCPCGDARNVWLAGHALLARSATLALSPDFGARAALLAQAVERVVYRSSREPFQLPPRMDAESKPSPLRGGPTDLRASVLVRNPRPAAEQPSPSGAMNEQPALRVRDVTRADSAVPLSTATLASPGHTPASQDKPESEPRAPGLPWMPETRAAGLLFLLNVWVRLGLPEWLRANPGWLEADLPQRLVARLLTRLGVEPGDPMWELASTAPLARNPPQEFVLPAHWRQGLTHGGRWYVHRSANGIGTRLLTDGSRLVLARWEKHASEAVHALTRGIALGRAISSQVDPPAIDQLMTAWLHATRRWLHRYARMRLRELVLRPGGVTIARTHADVVLDHRLADLRIRRSGLDLDPGWLPWFGRVVGFRYEARESNP